MSGVDAIATLLSLVEKHAQSITFDYSATQLLATWLREAMDKIPVLASAASLVNALGEAMQLTSGLAQTEVWTAFRDASRPVELDAAALAKINSVGDISESPCSNAEAS